jgi:hypothetical protein
VKNHASQPAGIFFLKSGPENNPFIINKKELQPLFFFNGKMLLNNTTFRNLFTLKDLPGNLKLHLRSLTLLFMELYAPADMHDGSVYDCIQENAGIIEEIIDRHNGAIINTMGNVIMVSFPRPVNGFLAACSLLFQVISGKKEDKPVLHLKIGLHEGHALVINRDNRLDYFGRTVSITAHILGLAGKDEIFFSGELFRDRNIRKELVKKKDKIKLYKKHIKTGGIGEKITIYKMIFR